MKPIILVAAFLSLLALPTAAQDKVTMALTLEPPGLDPTMQPAAAVTEVTWPNIFEGLTTIDEKAHVLPGLAESWTAEDNKLYVFKLRKGVKFHDGADFTAADVKFTFERNAGAASTNKRKRIFLNMASIETPDAATVRIALKEPSHLLPFFLAEATAAILSPKTAEQDVNTPIGTGPYKFTRWARGDRVEMERFDGHRDAAKLGLRQATIRFIPDPNAVVGALLAGDIDYAPNFGAFEAVARFKADPRFQVLVGSTEGEAFLGINNKQPPFTDPRIRRAVNFAVDRKAVIDGANDGYGQAIASHATPSNAFYVDLTPLYPHDPAKAKSLLAEAGFPNGFETSFKLPPMAYARRAGEILAAELGAVGIRAKMEPIEWAQWLDIVYKQKNYGLTVIMQPEPWDIFNYTDVNYFYNYDSAAFRALMKEVEGAKSDGELKEKLAAAQKMLAEDAVNAWLYAFPKVGVAKKGLAGLWKDAPMAVYPFAEMRWEK